MRTFRRRINCNGCSQISKINIDIKFHNKNSNRFILIIPHLKGGECVQGERLRKWREKEKMSQEELAEKSNVSRTTIHLIESGQSSTVKIRTLQKLAVVFNKQVKDFF